MENLSSIKTEQQPSGDTCIQVAVPISVYDTFTYTASDYLKPFLSVGKRVVVPFGKQHVAGYILKIYKDPPECSYELKKILDIIDNIPLFPPSLIPFFRWISDYYFYPIGEVIRTALPGGLNFRENIRISITREGKALVNSPSLTPVEKQILTHVIETPSTQKIITRKLGPAIPGATFIILEKKRTYLQRKIHFKR